MHLENSVKLDFKDVLIRPKRSTLTSRSEVDITREFKFLHSSEPYHGIPIIAANMDTTGTSTTRPRNMSTFSRSLRTSPTPSIRSASASTTGRSSAR